jgi:GGDEF domain-containing protein
MAAKPETDALHGRFKKIFGLSLAVAVGCYLGSGTAGEWLVDLWHIITISWTEKRASLSAGSTVLLLVAGFLLGQGVFLFSKRWLSELRQRRVHSAEGIAAWDPSLSVATRFGLHRYLEQCERWTSEDPTTRIPSLALFKIKGLGALNDTRGTLVATELLQDIAVELRVASLPDSSGRLRHFLTRFRPRPQFVRAHGTPPPRFAARWSGAKFALAFRELEALQAISVVRDLTAWVRRELTELDGNANLEIRAALAIGTPGIQPRELATAALKALDAAKADALVTVVHDPTDLRGPAIAQMVDVAPLELNMHRADVEPPSLLQTSVSLRNRFEHWLKNWGATAACFVGALIALQLGGGGKALPPSVFPWPDTVTEFPIVDSSGTRTVRLERSQLPNATSSAFKLSNLRIIQANAEEKRYLLGQVHLTIENTSTQTQYVSFCDFQAVDASQHRIAPEPERMIRVSEGIVGRWLRPGEIWSGWLFFRRMNTPIVGLEFQPDRFNHLLVQND